MSIIINDRWAHGGPYGPASFRAHAPINGGGALVGINMKTLANTGAPESWL